MAELDSAQVAQLLKDVRELKDIEACKRLRYAYFRCMDTAAFDEFETLLSDDFHCNYVGSSYEFIANSKAEFIDMIVNSFDSNMGGTHQGHHPEIDIVGEDDATGRWYLQDVVYKYATNELIYGTAIYSDRYRREADGWKICYSEYFRVVEVVEFPPRPPHFTGRYLEKHGLQRQAAE